MYRNIPTCNKICSTKENYQNQLVLVNHLQHMRSQIDTRAPQKFEFLQNKKKRDQLQQSKQTEIDRENKHLLDKITQLHSASQGSKFPTKKSLNEAYRKKELIKIVMENQALLKRIQDSKSKYDSKLWRQERKDIEKYIVNISEFPFKDYKPTKTLVQFWNTSKLSESQLNTKAAYFPKKLEPLSRNSKDLGKRDQSVPKPFVITQDNNVLKANEDNILLLKSSIQKSPHNHNQDIYYQKIVIQLRKCKYQ